MRAARIHEIGSLPQVDEIADVEAAEVLRVSMSTLNPVDVAIGTGRFYGGTPPTPYVIGSEAVGRMPDGRRVWARGRQLMTELVDPTAAEWVFDIPDGLGDEGALVCGTAGLTAWLAVSWRAPVQPDDTVLVLGASGTLGSVAVQGAKLLGARRVIGAARRTDLVPAAADEIVDLNVEGPIPEATYIVDGLWGEPFERAMASAAVGVRVVHLGQSAGPAATVQSAWVRGKVAGIFGHSLFALPEAAAETGYEQLAEHVRDGAISVDSDTYPLEAIAEAWQRQASGSPGSKILVEL
jgi:NADPH2:quinone reductase